MVGLRLRRLLGVVFGLFALLAINAVYLSGIRFLEWRTGETLQNFFYQYMFLAHLVLGGLFLAPVVLFGILHLVKARHRPNRRAVRAGYALFATALILMISGLLLTRGIPGLEVRHPGVRSLAFWVHVAAPLVAAWLFVLHRLAGSPIRWRIGVAVAGVAGVFALAAALVQSRDPRQWNVAGPAAGDQYFAPSLARTATGNFIPASVLAMDSYCLECHADVHAAWSDSMHRFASFNNPVYLASIRSTRQAMLDRDGTVQGARFCAGCHDPVPFFSGAFDDPAFDDIHHPTAQAGITCTSCHAITHINSPRGNADYTIEEPLHYPFAFSDNPVLQWVNQALIKANPGFHRKTFLKPFHRSPEFCGTCHKVHLPEALNGYKWLRGQNHYDSYHLSGVSGHGVTSFYYPPKAEHNCNGCHMPPRPSDDFGSRPFGETGELMVHDHQFPSANTGVPHLVGLPDHVNRAHQAFLEGAMRVDLFGVRRGGTVEGDLLAPVRPNLPVLEPGGAYLLEIVIRTVTMGHAFTEGTADSNQVWLEVSARSGSREIGRSGALDPRDGSVDPWSHFVNAYVLDREGNRIDRRNAEDIFTALYNHQIPPGAADTVHYRLQVPEDIRDPVEIRVRLNYRKFDTTLLRFVQGDAFVTNDLPITVLAEDRVVLPVEGTTSMVSPELFAIDPWERFNDYGIGLLRKPGLGQLRQAEAAFRRVEAMGRPDGPINLARVYLREGRVDDAAEAMGRAAHHQPPAPPWLVAYFTGEVNRQNGYLDEAIAAFRDLVATRFAEAREREFDFSQDYRLVNLLAQTLFERSKWERGDGGRGTRHALLEEAADWFAQALVLDPENTEAHYGLAQVYARLDRPEDAARHRRLHETYRVDDNARDRAVAIARGRDSAADHAANDVVVYDLYPDVSRPRGRPSP